MTAVIDFILHVDRYLIEITNTYESWTYLILFVVIFAETGLVVAPFLPGDSVLFAMGALIAKPQIALSLIFMYVLLALAAILGDFLNYAIGKRFGRRLFQMNMRLLKPEYIQKTERFYQKHGAKMIVYARFIPLVRTFAPFVAGIVSMPYRVFGRYNIFGALLWVSLFLIGGYLFGQIPFVEEHFSLVIIGVLLVSLIPPLLEYFKKSSSAHGA